MRDGLLLGLLEVRVGAGGVVGDVDDAVDLGDSPGDRHFDALAEGDCGHAAALTPPAQAQIGGGAFDARELGVSAVAGDARVDIAVEHGHDATGDVGVQAGPGRCGRTGRADGGTGSRAHREGRKHERRRRRLVGVDDHEPAV